MYEIRRILFKKANNDELFEGTKMPVLTKLNYAQVKKNT
jgi:hypothetical protein